MLLESIPWQIPTDQFADSTHLEIRIVATTIPAMAQGPMQSGPMKCQENLW